MLQHDTLRRTANAPAEALWRRGGERRRQIEKHILEAPTEALVGILEIEASNRRFRCAVLPRRQNRQ
jgi:hypothetical protein